MFDPTKPVRHLGNDSATVEILGHMRKAEEFRNQPILVVVVTDSTGAQRVGYRHTDGSHPNQVQSLDLVNIDTAGVAHKYQTLFPEVAGAIKTLWKRGYHDPVVSIMRNVDHTLDPRDIRHYFTGLFGNA